MSADASDNFHADAAGRPVPVTGYSRDQEGYVYFIQPRDGGPIKIGWATNVEARFAAIQACSPVLLRCLGYHGGTPTDERAYHRRLKHLRLHGEWFQPAAELDAIIGDLRPDTRFDDLARNGHENWQRHLAERRAERDQVASYRARLKADREAKSRREKYGPDGAPAPVITRRLPTNPA